MDNKFKLKSQVLEKLPWFVIFFSVFYIILMLALSYLIDIKTTNFFGLNDWLNEMHPRAPIFWFQMFKNGAITEIFQRLLLGASLMLSIYLGGVQITRYSHFPVAWIFLNLGLLLMLAEDIYDVRFIILHLIAMFSKIELTFLFESIWGTLVEASFYAFLGLIMLIFFVLILRNKNTSHLGKKLLIAGYSFYAFAGICSVANPLRAGNLYSIIGEHVLDLITQGTNLYWSGSTVVSGGTLGFWFMDTVFEESIELLGATFLLAALTTFIPTANHYD